MATSTSAPSEDAAAAVPSFGPKESTKDDVPAIMAASRTQETEIDVAPHASVATDAGVQGGTRKSLASRITKMFDRGSTIPARPFDVAAKQYLAMKKQGCEHIDENKLAELREHLSADDMDGLDLITDWGKDEGGQFSISEVLQVAKHFRRQQAQIKNLKKTVCGMGFLTAFFGMFLFGICIAAVYVLKDSFVSEDGVMQTANGTAIQVASSDLYMTDGVLMQRTSASTPSCSTTGSERRLQNGEPDQTVVQPVATAQAKLPRRLSSSMGDSYFQQLDNAVFTGRTGTVVYVSILGFVRVPDEGAQCGSLVYLLTAKGHIMLDSTDVSFEEGAWDEFMGHTFEFAFGGLGRRLVNSDGPMGFFNALPGAVDDWACKEVPPPSMPAEWSAIMSTYSGCMRQAGLGDENESYAFMSPCESIHGGLKPGVLHGLPMALLRAKAAAIGLVSEGFEATEDVIANAVEHVDSFYQVRRQQLVHTSDYSLTVEVDPVHPGQHQIQLVRKSDLFSTSFQAFRQGRKQGERLWCSNVTADERRVRRLFQAQASSEAGRRLDESELSMQNSYFLEYKGIWMENEQSYRHWRLHPKYSELLDFNDTEAIKFFDYWESSATMQPYRIVTPQGSITVFEDVKPATADDVDQVLGLYNLTTADALAEGCDIDAVDQSTEEVPRLSPIGDISLEEAVYYLGYHGDDFEEVFADPLVAGTDADDSAQEFDDYLQKALLPFALPDACAALCEIPKDLVAQGEADGLPCQQAQEHLGCLLGQSLIGCRLSNFATTAFYCDPDDANTEGGNGTELRLLQATERRLSSRRRRSNKLCRRMKFRLGRAKLELESACDDVLVGVEGYGNHMILGMGVRFSGSVKVTTDGTASGEAEVVFGGRIFGIVSIKGGFYFKGYSKITCQNFIVSFSTKKQKDCSQRRRRRRSSSRRRRAYSCKKNKLTVKRCEAPCVPECEVNSYMTLKGHLSVELWFVRAVGTATYRSETNKVTVSARADLWVPWPWSYWSTVARGVVFETTP
eukprot:TRINITY_DN7389_c0_g1_i7.p1 TRINITY_DN7389_c0_g1~~TRINITY_DN7389_c0_g1_i7.p1  ORF type:complete len:1017 (-),score=174.97 TRINITY_DN7389_c0_g1_i7:323-3373(-)